MHARIRLAFLAALLAACGAPASTELRPAPAPAAPLPAELEVLDPAYARPLEALAAEVEAQRRSLHVPGVALAIVKDDRLIFARGFGLADVAAGRPVTPGTLFAIGSTSKAFTATLVAMLADEGRLAFDDPITKALPWFAPPIDGEAGETLGLRDLLSHRTGFAHMDMLWYGGSVGPEEVLRTALRAEPVAPFRQKFLYNNVMYLAAGQACAAVAGRSWSELMRARFFEPLGMTSSNTSVAEAQRDERLALGYRWDAEGERFERVPMRPLEGIAPAGAINSNALDLSRWVRFLLGRGELEGVRLISEASLAETWKTHNQLDPETRYGLGWFLRTWRGQPFVEHGGNIDGFAAEVALLPEEHLGVVLLCNVGATPLQGAIGPQVFEALLGAPPADEGSAEAAPAAEDLTRYTGTYIANYFQFHDAEFEVSLVNGRLAIDVPGQSVFELLPPGPDGKRPFALVPDAIQASFLEEGGRVVALQLHQGGLVFEVPRPDYAPAPEIDPAELEPYLGSYADPLTQQTFRVVVARHRLALDYPEQMVYELLPPDEEERWVFRASAQMAVEFHFDGDDVVESLTFHERGTRRECERLSGPAPLPSLAEVLALRRAPAFEERLLALGTCRLRGKIRFVHSGIEGTSTVTFDAGGRFVEETDLAPFATTRTAHDGERMPFESSLEPARELTGASADLARMTSPAVFYGDWSRRFDQARVERVSEGPDGRRLVRIELVMGAAPALVVDVDAATGDLFAAEVTEIVDGAGRFAKRVRFEGWRETGGLRLPARVITEDDAVGRVLVEYGELEAGIDACADPFALAASPESK